MNRLGKQVMIRYLKLSHLLEVYVKYKTVSEYNLNTKVFLIRNVSA